jgi:hypothetical protein
MKNTHVVAAKHATEKVINRSVWRNLQNKAKHLGVTVDALLQEQGQRPSERITIELPTAFVSLLKRELGDFMSASQFERVVSDALLTLDLDAYCEQLADSIHRNRNAAYRAAVAVFVRDHSRHAIALRYRCSGRVQSEMFKNPLGAIRAA